MRGWLGFIVAALMVLLAGSPVLGSDEAGWSWEPIEAKHSLSVTGSESTRLDWGMDYNYPGGQLQITGWGSCPDPSGQIALEWAGESGVWNWSAWGIMKIEENYHNPSSGVSIQWEDQRIAWDLGVSSANRQPVDPGNRFGYSSQEIQGSWGYHFSCGTVLDLGFHQKETDYPDNGNSSLRMDLNGSFRWMAAKDRWVLSWKEWSTDYLDKPLSNGWGQEFGLKWTHPSNSRQWVASVTVSDGLTGDGLTNRKGQLSAGETFYLSSVVWSWKLTASWQSSRSWIEDVYDLTGEALEDWGLSGEAVYGATWSWRKEFGPHTCWRLGGGIKTNKADEWSWSFHTEYDFYLTECRIRLYLNLTGNENQSEAGAWIKLTYYFT